MSFWMRQQLHWTLKVSVSISKVWRITEKEKTAIFVAHRLATVMNADRILVFSEGRVVEEGTHQQIIDQS